MAKTVKQLEAEYAKISEENRKAYDELNGSGTGVYSWQNRYDLLIGKKDLSEKQKAELAELKPRHEAAAAAYKKTQEAKNALKKELEAARKAETDKKESSANLKSAQSVYDKAITELNRADAGLSGYKGDQKYIDAYKKAQEAADALTKAGGKASVPQPKITIPVAEQDQTGTGSEGESVGTGITSFTDAVNYLTDPKNKEALIQAQKLLGKFGYKGNTKGDPDISFTSALNKAAEEYRSLPAGWRPASLLDYIKNPLGGALGTGGTGGGPEVSVYPTITNKQDGRITINKYFQDNFGRDATSQEFEEAYAKIVAEQKAKPTKRVATKNAKGETIYETTGGTNTEQILNNFVGSKSNLKSEAATYEASDAKVLQRQKDKKLYEAELAKLGGDATKIAALNASTPYGRSIASMQAKLARLALAAGSEFSPEELAQYAKEAIDQSLDTDAESLTSFINSKMKFTLGKDGIYKGVAGQNIDALNKVAAANGLDLQKAFGAQLPDWLNAINKGESIDTYKKMIRDVAKIGMPEKIAKLIDQGVDLATIYSPYKNLMANTLEINPQSISLDDPTLRSAITADKEVPLYEFERALRQDNRWQYTNQAKEEVSNATRKILQDFGFMG
jgi:hypothetical protein